MRSLTIQDSSSIRVITDRRTIVPKVKFKAAGADDAARVYDAIGLDPGKLRSFDLAYQKGSSAYREMLP
jgi:hypothetical protein